jgi:hypothetical protein
MHTNFMREAAGAFWEGALLIGAAAPRFVFTSESNCIAKYFALKNAPRRNIELPWVNLLKPLSTS